MIALDTNLLVYAHRPETHEHEAARAALAMLPHPWALPWPVAHEFVRVVTEPRWFTDPTPLDRALGAIAALLECGGCRPIGEGPGHWTRLGELTQGGRAGRTLLYDARIAASALAGSPHDICLASGVSQLAALPGNVAVPADLGGLQRDSVANVTQVATIDRRTLEERLGGLDVRRAGPVARSHAPC